ncbi:hypothetical protein B0H11DRAFT_2023670 [Mycena galericulata]|nr:hypothetical protein B0H11DRAFT_2023670 [Mycena galericulata]
MRIPSLLISVFSLQVVRSVQINTIIDDAIPLVTYRAPVLDRNLTGFNSSLLNNGTVTFVPPTQNDSPTIAMNFTGTAVYIFVAYPSGHNESFTSGFIARIDDIPSGGWAVAQTAPLYNRLAYPNTTLANAPHSLVIQIGPEWELYFDYVVYTSGAGESPVPSCVQYRILTQDRFDSNFTEKKFPVGALIGGAIGGLIFLSLVATPWCLQVLDKEGPPSPVTPFMLHQSKRSRESKKSAHGVGIHTAQSPGEAASESPISAISDPGSAMMIMAQEFRCLTASV